MKQLRILRITLLFILCFLGRNTFSKGSGNIKVLESTIQKVFPGLPGANIMNEYAIKVLILKKGVSFSQAVVGADSLKIRIFANKEQLKVQQVLNRNDTILLRFSAQMKQDYHESSEKDVRLIYTYKKKRLSSKITNITQLKSIYLP